MGPFAYRDFHHTLRGVQCQANGIACPLPGAPMPIHLWMSASARSHRHDHGPNVTVAALANAAGVAASHEPPVVRLQSLLEEALASSGARRGCVFVLDRTGAYGIV